MDGVFKYLFDKHQDNPITIGIISIEGNSYNPSWALKLPQIINPKFLSYWLPNPRNMYFKISFNNFVVRITKYRIRVGNGNGGFLFDSWTMTGQNEKNEEVVLDDVDNCSEITSTHPEATIEIKNDDYMKSVRVNIKGTKMADMGTIEFYGFLKFYDHLL